MIFDLHLWHQLAELGFSMLCFHRFAIALVMTAIFACSMLAGCGKSQAEKNPDEIPPRPTGMRPASSPSSSASTPVTNGQNSNQPSNAIPVR